MAGSDDRRFGPRVFNGAPVPLFERLLDLDPARSVDLADARRLSLPDLRISVGRAIGRLFDTRRPEALAVSADRTDLTVLDYGIPDLGTLSPADPEVRRLFAKALRNAIRAFEPRLRNAGVEVYALPDRPHALYARVTGSLAAGDVVEPVVYELNLAPADGAEEVERGVAA
jgi:type VI secretion system lysozyme-like protein